MADSISLRIEALLRRLGVSAFRIDFENLINSSMRFTLATHRDPRFHKVGLFPDESDIEHALEYQRH